MTAVEYIGAERASRLTEDPQRAAFLVGLINRMTKDGPGADTDNLQFFAVKHVLDLLDAAMPKLNATGQTVALEVMALLR